MNKKTKMLTRLTLLLTLALTLASCVDGFKDDETFQSSVQNQQMVSPTLSKSCFTTTTISVGGEQVEAINFTWPLVEGAGGYVVNVTAKTIDGDIKLVTDSVVDGRTLIFQKAADEDAEYLTSVLALGNAKYNNTDAAEASTFLLSLVAAKILIPGGNDVAEYINTYINTHAAEMEKDFADDPNNYEVCFELEANQTYTMKDSVDFRLFPAQLRCVDAQSYSNIVTGQKGYLTTQAGLKVRGVKFDCTELSKSYGLLTLGAEPDASISTETLGFKADGANQDGFVIMKDIKFNNCLVKNLPDMFIFGNQKNWSINSLTILNCIIQANNEANTKAWISFEGASNGLIRKMLIQNSTFFNVKQNPAEQYFMRFGNSSNAQPKKIFGNSGNLLEFTVKSSSFLNTNPKKDFANNMPNTQNSGKLWIKVEDCVFYDVFRLYQLIQSQWIKTTTNNYMSYSDFCSPTTTDYGPAGRTDNSGNFYTTLDETPAFQQSMLKELDFSQPNGGLRLAPAGIAATAKAGDPRWY